MKLQKLVPLGRCKRRLEFTSTTESIPKSAFNSKLMAVTHTFSWQGESARRKGQKLIKKKLTESAGCGFKM
jgi:hypothetical protein